MDKNAIKKYAVWARRELIERVSQKAQQYGITADEVVAAGADSVYGHVLSATEKTRRDRLVQEVRSKGYEQTMEEAAYTWFNRFIALRFMEVNGYLPSHVRVFTDEDNNFKPQILTEAINLDLDGLDMEKVYELKNANKTEELYKYLLLTQCNALGAILPGMFQSIDDYMELLFPDNLLREGSVVERLIAEIDQEDWRDQVQIIGWLYQYYNSDLFSSLYDGEKATEKICATEMPSATQLFTPDWIVRYMVENSLGRLWVEGHPNEELKSGWKYYLNEAEQEPEVQAQLDEIRKGYASLSPEDIKCIDPCMGSGHILVYLFDVLIQIYETQGYSRRDAVSLILQNNLYGLDIDDRAAQLAYFSVMMKARQYDRRIFSSGIQPHIYSIAESNSLDKDTIDYFVGDNVKLRNEFETLVDGLRDAKEYGSILNISQLDFSAMYARVEEVREDISLRRERVLNEILPLIQVGETLATKYHAAVTNPPYLNANRMNPKLSTYVAKNYKKSKQDMSMVMYQAVISHLLRRDGFVSFITPSSWMFSSKFKNIRLHILDMQSIVSLVDAGTELFDGKVGHLFICAWVARNIRITGYSSEYVDVSDYCYARKAEKEEQYFNPVNQGVFHQDNFGFLPDSPIAYNVKESILRHFVEDNTLSEYGDTKKGLSTSDNERFVRLWHEVDFSRIKFGCQSPEDTFAKGYKWYPYVHGGKVRKWSPSFDSVVNFQDDAAEIKSVVLKKYPYLSSPDFVVKKTDIYFKSGIIWNDIASTFNAKWLDAGYVYSDVTPLYIPNCQPMEMLGFFNSNAFELLASVISQGLHYSTGHVPRIPYVPISGGVAETVSKFVEQNVEISKEDEISFETSWDFQYHPIVRKADSRGHWGSDGDETIEYVYRYVAQDMEERFQKLKANEEELNRIFIEIYGLQDELTPEVEDKDVTVRRPDLQRDIKSLISYAVGCMFGRYSLDTPGLAYAGGTWDDSKYRRFQPDRDNIIPITDDEYFEDDIVARFIRWVEVVFGRSTLEENLKFIADSLGGTGAPRDVIRSYFLNDFYADHLKTYQKRPIYWLFDSGKKGGFKALIYMHRYQPDTIARMRTDYVHEQQSRYRTAIADVERRMKDASTSEQVKLKKRLAKLQAQDAELLGYEEKIHHLADQMIRIDLDDGVKVNYAKFQDVLAPIK